MQFWTASVLLAFAANAVMAAPSPVDLDDMGMDMGENPGYYGCHWVESVCCCFNSKNNRTISRIMGTLRFG
ncbi:hypothetical protein CFIMG_008488RA00001 [Ceratocystis fimbriata CBS 114723]|uniref:Uncharacterized protein n=1 Tax=Ceratocystis fimbriata CBS 114723 TaxID=1035309 RepID=A0A2C5WSD1_9PEZI|nr:hypothetical protein CFIMG_008488RA00001 [Ceratocystis fimbriata CBS 114723]